MMQIKSVVLNYGRSKKNDGIWGSVELTFEGGLRAYGFLNDGTKVLSILDLKPSEVGYDKQSVQLL